MIEKSYAVMFFLKTARKRESLRLIYLRITVNGISKEMSIKRKWDVNRWDQKKGKATGNRQDALSLNYFLDSLMTKIGNFRTSKINNELPINANDIIEHLQGKSSKTKPQLLEEFKEHNDEILSLAEIKEYSMGTYERYKIALHHVTEFIQVKYNLSDIDFNKLNFEFIRNYELYLKTVRRCSSNTALKYIAYLKTIVIRAVAKDIIDKDPFKLFKSKREKLNKKPLTTVELQRLENKQFNSSRLSTVRDIFVFQCYTGLCYIDVFQLKRMDIKQGIDGKLWIISNRQKSKASTDIPLLPNAINIIEKYKDDPICHKRNSVLPVKSNQKMNEYLKEIAELFGLPGNLNTHMARRTFGSTITLKNGVPIHIVKKMMGHSSVRQTEEYAITAEESVAIEMQNLKFKLSNENKILAENPMELLLSLKSELESIKGLQSKNNENVAIEKINKIAEELKNIQKLLHLD